MNVAISQMDSVQHESLHRIAQTFLIKWKKAHGRPGDSPQAALSNHGLTVTIDNALTAAEKKLLRKPAGRQLVQRYVSHLVDHVYPELADTIERQLHCYVSHWMVDVEPEHGHLRFSVSLQQMPSPTRALAA